MDTAYGRILKPDEFVATVESMIRDLDGKCQVLYQGLQQHMKEPLSERRLSVKFVDNGALNAFASLEGSDDVIIICRGVIEHIYGISLGLFSTKSFLPSIGDVAAETHELELHNGSLPRMPLIRRDGIVESGYFHLPRDSTRMLAAFAIAELAVEFILFHEIGHLIGGHVDISPMHQCCQHRLSMNSSLSVSGIDRQMYECDADAFAGHTSSTVTLMHNGSSKLWELLNRPDWTPIELEFLIFVAAVGMLFRILDCDARADVITSADHPHPAVRSCFVVSCAFARAIHTGKLTASSALKIAFAVIGNIEEIWAKYLLPGSRLLDTAVFAEQVESSMWDLFRRFNAYGDELQKLARLPRKWCDWAPLSTT